MSFKKGNIPVRKRPIGAEGITNGYLQRKVKDTGNRKQDWKYVHHLVWRAAGRRIPRGHVLTFIDGNRMNVSLDNLKLVTRGESTRRAMLAWYDLVRAKIVPGPKRKPRRCIASESEREAQSSMRASENET